MKKFVLGINGFIGSGKTFAGKFFQQKGAYFINADQVVDDLYEKNRDGYLHIKNFFGDEFMTAKGEVNKKKLARFVFADPKKLKILHYIIHPVITNEVQKLLDATEAKFIVLESIYFEEKHLLKFVNKMLWLDADFEICKKRIIAQKRFTEKMFDQVLRAQKKYLIKPKQIDFTVVNNGTLEKFAKDLEKVWVEVQAYIVER